MFEVIMETIGFILMGLSLIAMGYCFGRLVMLGTVMRELEDLDVMDPQFDGKIYILKKFNTL